MSTQSEQADSTGMPRYGRTFPMYVPPIDWYFLSDDGRDYPMVFYLDLDFTGSLDPEKLDVALREAVYRHPLLLCVMQNAKQDRLCWVLAPEKMPSVKWVEPETRLMEPGEDFVDIRETPGLRVWARKSDGRTQLTLQFHHSACDGTGAYRFVGDFLACYMRLLPSCKDKVDVANFDPAQLKVRTSKLRTVRMMDSKLKKFGIAARYAWQQISARVTPLRDPKTGPHQNILPGMVKHEFSGEDLAALRTAATTRGGTLNDLFLCKMFLAAREWNQQTSGRLRVLVPADMRDGNDFEIPACNMTACTFITRKASELDDEAKLLELIRTDTLKIKSGAPQADFINAVTSAMEGNLLPWIMNRCMATSVLSNAGDPSRRFTCKLPKRRGKVSCDEFTLDAISGVPPMRRLTRSTLSVSTYGRKLTVSLRCDPLTFNEADSRGLLAMFCDRLQSEIEPAS